jgi:four helix bundle protein
VPVRFTDSTAKFRLSSDFLSSNQPLSTPLGRADEAVLAVYVLTRKFPMDERFGLSAQMRRAAASVPANIAEGYGRRGPREKAGFYSIATGSAEELKYFLILAKDLKYVPEPESLWASVEDVCRMLRRLTESTLRGSHSS